MKRIRSVRMLVIGGTVLCAAAAFTAVGGARTAAAPSNTALPSISGTTTVGHTLVATSGSWSGANPITYAYKWERCDGSGANCNSILGANQQTYAIHAADAANTLRVVVTAKNSDGSTNAMSDKTAVIQQAPPPTNTATPTVSGSPIVGGTLTVSTGSWTGANPITYTYQWRRCDTGGANCSNINSQTSNSHVVVSSDVGHTLRAIVTATNAGGSAQATSGASSTITVGSVANTAAPVVTGTPTSGQTLTVSNGTWTGSSPTFTYQWQRCDSAGNNCADVSGATKQTYPLGSTDVGHKVRANVTATNSGGHATASSNTVGPVASTTPPPPAGTTKLPNGETSIQASSVSETDRLLISSVRFTPSVITGRAPVTVTFKVIENSKYDVAGALVYVLGLPYGWAKASPEAATAADGTVSITITPTKASPKRGALVLFVRARTPSGSLLAGSSTRRLVQVSLRP